MVTLLNLYCIQQGAHQVGCDTVVQIVAAVAVVKVIVAIVPAAAVVVVVTVRFFLNILLLICFPILFKYYRIFTRGQSNLMNKNLCTLLQNGIRL